MRLGRPSIARLVQWSCANPVPIALVALALAVAAVWFAGGHFKMTSNTAELISPKVQWRRDEIAMDAAFPQLTDNTVVVVDGKTPELAEAATAALAAKLQARKDLFDNVTRPDGGPFFAREGLLFESPQTVQSTTDQIVSAQGFLGPLAADPSLRGIMTTLSTLATGVQQGQTTLAAVDKPVRALADTLQSVEQGKPTFFSWQNLIGAGPSLSAPLRRFIILRPKLNYAALMPGAKTTQAVRDTAQAMALDPAHGVTVRLTGAVPLADEEFASLSERWWLVFGSMILAVVVMLWLAVKSAKIVVAILITTILGLLLTSAVGLAAVGRFNLISVAFIPLFVGLGVDFGIQFSVRFRAERLLLHELKPSLIAAGSGIGRSLALAAAAITLGFFAFLPTNYIGVSELGIIAGLGMVIGLALNLILLPALLTLLRPAPQDKEVGSAAMAPVDRFLITHRKLVLWAFAISTLVSVALLPLVHFDFNPYHLRNPHGEAMSTLADIMRNPQQTPNTIAVLTPSLAAAQAMGQRLSKLPEVAQTVTLASYVPENQAPKLAAIQNANLLLDPTLNPFDMQPPPSDADTVQALRSTAAGLRQVSASPVPGAADAQRLAAALDALANGPPSLRARATQVLIPPLNTMLDEIRAMLQAQPVTLQSLPPELARDWVAPNGQARVQASPRGDSNSNAVLKRFSAAVRQIAPNATGAPISVQQAGHTISWAFIEAGLLSLVAICILLMAVLRSLREVAFTLAPIVLAGFLTLATCVVVGLPINFANIIAFPLLFGVGVAFHIYFVMAWRAGQTNLLQSSLARGVFFSALTTGAAFGSLIFSSHPGTASMGWVLMISLVWTLVAALLFEPALLGPPDPKLHSNPGR